MANELCDTMIDPKTILGTPEWIDQVYGPQSLPLAEPRVMSLCARAKVLAGAIVHHCPASADRTVALRKLREALHCALDAIALGGVG